MEHECNILSKTDEVCPRHGHSHAPPDPAHERVRVILDCAWGDLQYALDMVIDAKPSFDRLPKDRPGWGWNWMRRGGPSLFVRRTKHGYSATAPRDSNTQPKERGCEAHRPSPRVGQTR